MNDHERWLAVAQATAQEAGALLRSRWRETHTVQAKGYRNIVTDTDVAAERLIISRLREHFPEHAITSEEAGAEPGSATVRWLIDPLDGTTNFSRNNPNFCVSLAVLERQQPVVGVIHDPLHEHTFAAQRGCGATLNGQPLHVSAATTLKEAICGVDWPRDNAQRQQMIQIAGELLTRGRTLRALGSAALAMAYVAAGWLDLYLALSLSPWDQAAAALMVQEAGGALATVSGAPWTVDAPDPLLAASPALLEAFRALQAGGER